LGGVRIDTILTDVRVFPLLEISREQLEQAAGGPIVSVERIDGGLTNTLHKVTLENGDSLGIKHYAGGRDWFETELTTLTLLHGTVPVPEVVNVNTDRHVIAYRWIEGITLHELRKQQQFSAFASLAEPLGRVCAWIAQTDATAPFELTPILEQSYRQLSTGRARKRIGLPSPTPSSRRWRPPSPRWRSVRSASRTATSATATCSCSRPAIAGASTA
jgi:hypothetical protein